MSHKAHFSLLAGRSKAYTNVTKRAFLQSPALGPPSLALHCQALPMFLGSAKFLTWHTSAIARLTLALPLRPWWPTSGQTRLKVWVVSHGCDQTWHTDECHRIVQLLHGLSDDWTFAYEELWEACSFLKFMKNPFLGGLSTNSVEKQMAMQCRRVWW